MQDPQDLVETMFPRVILYTEDPPTGATVVATGLSRANRHIVRALKNHLVAALTVCTALRHPIKDSDLDENYRAIHHWLFRFRPHIAHAPLGIRRALNLPLHIPSGERAWVRDKLSGAADILLIPVGTDIEALQRAITIGATLDIGVVAYLVDDPVAAAALSNKPFSHSQMAVFKANLLACRGVMCITNGLAKAISNEYGIACIPAHLPFERSEQICPDEQRTGDIAFIGNTSHFYQDGLVEMCKAIAQRRLAGDELRLVFSICTPFVQQLSDMFGDLIVSVKPCASDLDLRNFLASSLAGFVSYSFDEEYSRMISTSYPSKLTEYLAACKHIIVYGPRDSTAVHMMRRYNLRSVLEFQSVDDLSALLSDLIASPNDYSENYVSTLASEHSMEQFRQALVQASRN